MRKKIIVRINDKGYPLIYSKSIDTYFVETNDKNLKPHITEMFSFHIKNGVASYKVTSSKTHEIAGQIIKQINEIDYGTR